MCELKEIFQGLSDQRISPLEYYLKSAQILSNKPNE